MRTAQGSTPLLWTGGWDSTFRLLQLLLVERRSVQPYYVIEGARRASSAEQTAMRNIRELLRTSHPEASARLQETIEVPLDQIAADAHIFSNYENALHFAFIGGQYEWLARMCAQRGVTDMELAIHRDDKARELLADLIDASRRQLDSRFAGDARYELFRYFRFPLFDMTKQQMRSAARKDGFEDFMALTWFCHRPRAGQPCGVCNPCIYTIEEGLADRVPLAGRIRYRLRVLPRMRRLLTRHPGLYMRVRSAYRKLRELKQRAPSHARSSPAP
jgi:7-cyano-7-deazaguanine synthase in queuosine biosynthesis